MNTKEATRRVLEIKMERGDPEAAHEMEDQLYHDFVWWVSRDGPEPFRGVAVEILKTDEIVFERWCA